MLPAAIFLYAPGGVEVVDRAVGGGRVSRGVYKG
jgi:hypothetical protein